MSGKLYTIILAATLTASIILAYFSDRYFPILEIIPPAAKPTGWLLIASGTLLLGYCAVKFMSIGTTVAPGGKPSVLVTKGPYSFSRNPIYLADLAMALGVSIVLGSLSSLVAPSICFAVLNFIVIPYEERRLSTLFGKVYQEYRNKVRRWI